jgi:hypothetical protein
MVTTTLRRPYEEHDEELITMEEFINKMRSFNEMEYNTRYPRDPHKYVYKIEVNNIYKRVHLLKAYDIIENKFEEIILAATNEQRNDIIVAMTNCLLERCLYDHTLKRIVYYAITQSGNQADTDESDTDESDTDESDTDDD